VDDSPVTIPGGARIQRLIPAAPDDDRPTEIQEEAEVREDGRFIFPSVEMYLRQDATDIDFNDNINPDCWNYRYDHFDLAIPGDGVLAVGDGTGYHVPRNRYGVAQGRRHADLPEVDPADYIFGFYLLGRDTYDTWQAKWPGRVGEYYPYPEPQQWCPLDPFTFDEMNLIIPVCYLYPPGQYSEDASSELVPGGRESNMSFWHSHELSFHATACSVILDPSRLDYPHPEGPTPNPNVGVGLTLFDPSVDVTAEVGFWCHGNTNGVYLSELTPTAYGSFRASDGDSDGHIVVIHGMAHYR
jgi:hypothetical protein